MKKFSLLLVIIAMLVYREGYSQLSVIEGTAMNMTPEQLVQNYLIGQGVTVSNVTYNGSSTLITSTQIGTFQTLGPATNQLGLSGGILMTSGKASLAIGPNGQAGAGTGTNGPGDPDLNAISSSTTHDKCVLEFDFIPQSDTIRFRYVFGSEEFFEYCNSYNDAFGFFLSGPGINGSFSNNSENIALMPGDMTNYVTINNICAAPLSHWTNTGGQYFQYDGLTYVFTAWHIVTPCSVYHIKIAVADAVDHALDSGVFLEQNSFNSPSVALNLGNTSPYLGKIAAEGCNDVQLYFTMESPLAYPYTAHFSATGTATNGVDYTLIPNQVTFPAGADSVMILIHPLVDNIPEGQETVIIKVNQISCDGTVATDTVIIDDYTPMTVSIREDTTICHGTSVRFLSEVSGGYPPLTYHWSNSTDNDSLLIVTLPVGQNTVTSTVTDGCPNSVSDNAIITVHPVPVANAGPNTSIPNGTSTTLSGSASGGYGNYDYQWTSNPPGFTSNQQNPNTGNLYYSTIFNLVATDQLSSCISDPSQVIVAVAGGVLSANPVAEPAVVCLGQPVTLYALAGGGSGLYSYSWTSEPPGFTSTQSSTDVTPMQNITYHVLVNDGFNTITGTTTVQVNPLPQIHLGPVDSTVCIFDSIVLDAGNPGSTYEWSNGSTTRSISIASAGLAFEIQTYKVIVTNPNGCQDSALINVIFSFNDCVGIGEKKEFRDFNIYPNPNNGTFHISMRPLEEITSLTIYNMQGMKVYSGILEAIPGTSADKEITLPGASAGIYLLQVSGRNYTGTKKILVR